jgi:hypothetical protein
VPGITGNVDGDRFNGTLADLVQFGVPATVSPAPTATSGNGQ